MLPQKQVYRHRPEDGVHGDCHRAALAALFDLPTEVVPHFAANYPGPAEFQRRVQEWLTEQGYTQFHILYQSETLRELLSHVCDINPGIYYLLGGRSRTGVDHTVIACDDQIVCDPSLDDSGIVGPCTDGYYWITLLIPLRFGRPMVRS